MTPNSGKSIINLPDLLRPFFWDQDFAALSWDNDRDFLVRRILQHGSWHAVCWLRTTLSDTALREWLESHAGGGLSPRQMRFWELLLDLPSTEVDRWIAIVKNESWGRRVKP